MSSPLLVGESFVTALLSISFLVVSVWKKEVFLSDVIWNKLPDQKRFAKFILATGLVSMSIYFIAEFSELSGTDSSIHDIGEVIHMFLIIVVFGALILLFRVILGGSDGS